MPPGRYVGTEYMPTEEELMALEQELAAAESVPSPGLGGGSYEAVPAPPPQQAAPPQPTYSVTDAGTYSGAGAGYPRPQALPTTPVPPPPTSTSAYGRPTADFAAPLGTLRNSVAASDAGRAIGNVLGAELPFADQLPPPPVAVGARLAAGDPGGAAQLAGDVAGENPVLTASLLAGPLVGGVARGLLGASRVARTAAPIARPATQTLDQLLRAGQRARMSPLRRTADDLGSLPILIAPPAAVFGALVEDSFASDERRAPSTGTTTGGGTAGGTGTTRPPANGSVSAAPAGATGSGGAGGRPASSAPTSAPSSASRTTPARTPTTSTPVVSAPSRSSSSPPSGTTGLGDAVEFASDAPFTPADFQGQLGDLPELRNISPTLARTMANTANAKFRRRRGKRGFPFSLERGEFHRLIRDSVFAALRSGRSG